MLRLQRARHFYSQVCLELLLYQDVYKRQINALWLLPLLGLIILMYLLKEEHEEMEISSLYLWKKVLADSEVKKPWQKDVYKRQV